MNQRQKRTKKELLIHKFGCRCWWSNCPSPILPANKLTIDHLIPKSLGGSNSLENLRLACLKCNNSRGNSLFAPDQPFKNNL